MQRSWNDPSEKMIENSILYWLNLQRGCFAIKIDVKGTWDTQKKFFRKVGKWTPLGCADILVCYKGKFGALEIKTPAQYKIWHQNPTEHMLRQKSFLAQVKAKGGFAECVCSLDEVRALFSTEMVENSPASP